MNVTEHRDYLKSLSAEYKKQWSKMTQGLLSIHAQQPEEGGLSSGAAEHGLRSS